MYFTDPDGRWPFPSWASVKSSYREAKATISRTYNETRSSVSRNYNQAKTSIVQATNNAVKTTKQALNDGQKWVKENKKEILNVANNLQDAGDAMAITGYGAAVIGAPVAGVGAAPGVALATAGNVVNLVGAGLAVATNLIAGDNKEAGKDAAWTVGGEALDFVVDRIVPGPTPDVSDATREIIKTGNDILKSGVTTKAIIIEHAVKE